MDILGTVAGGLSGALGQARYELRAGIYFSRELEVLSVEGAETLNAPFVYDVVFATAVDEGELQAEVFGFPACLTIHVPNHDAVVIQGIAVALEAIGDARSDGGTERRTFSVRIVPPLWLMNHSTSYRVFQDQNAIAIATAVLNDAGVPVTVYARHDDHPPIPFVYQRGETDLAFLERVLATAGIFYYFEHSNGLLASLAANNDDVGPITTLVLCDTTRDTDAMADDASGAPNAGPTSAAASVSVGSRDGDKLPYDPDGHTKDGEHVSAFKLRKEIRPGAVYVQDWDVRRSRSADFAAQRPKVDCSVRAGADGLDVHKVSSFTSDTLSSDLTPDALAVTEYQRDGAVSRAGTTSYYATRALAQLRSDWAIARGRSNCSRMAPGYRFWLTDHPVSSVNGEYLTTEVRSRGVSLDHQPGGDTETYSNEFVCVPVTVDPRPAKPALRPADGPEPAEVLGPMRGEIHTDGLGRIQVRFRWGESSDAGDPRSGLCWAKCLIVWGGDGYGTMNTPRAGSEVWVEFPQQVGGIPVAVGQLRTEANKPPYALPGEASRVGIRSNALPPDGLGYSEISIQDRTGAECVNIRSQKDMSVEVLNDSIGTIGNIRCVSVASDDTLRVGGNALESVGGDKRVDVSGQMTMTAGSNYAITAIGCSSDVVIGHRTIQTTGALNEVANSRSTRVEGDCSLTVQGAYRQAVGTPDKETASDVIVYGTQTISATKVHIRGETEIVIECGSTRIELKEGTLAQFAKVLSATVSSVDIEADDKVTVVAANTTEMRGQTVRSIASGSSLELTDGASLQGSSVKMGSNALSASSQSNSSSAPSQVAFTTKVVDENGKGLDSAKYHLYYDGTRYSGTTDGSGGITAQLVQVQGARIYLRVWPKDFPKSKPVEYDITWGAIPPVSSNEGVLTRLRNLGHFRGNIPVDQPEVLMVMKQRALASYAQSQVPTANPDAPDFEQKVLAQLQADHGH